MRNLLKPLALGLLLSARAFTLWGGIPPMLHDMQSRLRPDAMRRAYVTPVRVVWQGGAADHTEALLRQGTGQPDLLAHPTFCHLKTGVADTASVLLDFGRELHGGLKLVLDVGGQREPALLRLRFGESVHECFSDTRNEADMGVVGYSTDDHAPRDFVVEAPQYGQLEVGSTGFRFVRIDLVSPGYSITLSEATAILRYRELDYVGSFHSSDARLDSIWAVGAYTTHLCMQEFIWDGIKRDRLVWLGDMHPEMSTAAVVFSDTACINRSLDVAIREYPLPAWMNTMTPYSMWYLIILHDWYMQHGDRAFLEGHRQYVGGLIERFDQITDARGEVHGGQFLDWPSSPDTAGVREGVKALLVWAMRSAENLCRLYGDSAHAALSRAVAARVRPHISMPTNLKQAAAIMTMAGVMEPRKAFKRYLSRGHTDGFSTFYGYYMLEAEAMAGEYQEALNVIRRYWGGMLDMGATTFWEDFDLKWMENTNRIDELGDPRKKNIGDYGAYCYKGFRHSLCHGWASGPTAWLSHHVLGVSVVEAGCKTVRIDPHLADLQFVEGSYPTPFGPIKLKHVRQADGSISSVIVKPRAVKIVTPLKHASISNAD